MAIYALHQFSNADVLNELNIENLSKLFYQFPEYFKLYNRPLPASGTLSSEDLLDIAFCLENPIFDGDTNLLDVLELIAAMAKRPDAPFILDYSD